MKISLSAIVQSQDFDDTRGAIVLFNDVLSSRLSLFDVSFNSDFRIDLVLQLLRNLRSLTLGTSEEELGTLIEMHATVGFACVYGLTKNVRELTRIVTRISHASDPHLFEKGFTFTGDARFTVASSYYSALRSVRKEVDDTIQSNWRLSHGGCDGVINNADKTLAKLVFAFVKQFKCGNLLMVSKVMEEIIPKQPHGLRGSILETDLEVFNERITKAEKSMKSDQFIGLRTFNRLFVQTDARYIKHAACDEMALVSAFISPRADRLVTGLNWYIEELTEFVCAIICYAGPKTVSGELFDWLALPVLAKQQGDEEPRYAHLLTDSIRCLIDGFPIGSPGQFEHWLKLKKKKYGTNVRYEEVL